MDAILLLKNGDMTVVMDAVE